MDKETVVVNDENLTEEEKAAQAAAAEKETAEQKAAREAEEAKQAEEEANKSPYKKQMEEIEAKRQKAEEEARQKAGALKEERRLRKEAEEKAKRLEDAAGDDDEEKGKKFLTPEQAEKIFDEKLKAQRFEDKLDLITADPDEKALIKHHYQTSIVKTGNVEADLKTARAIANQHLIDQAKELERDREEGEKVNVRFQSGGSGGSSKGTSTQNNPRFRGAAQLLKNIGAEDAIKHLS